MEARHDAAAATVASLEALREVLLREEWFVVRPPLALAIAHPLARLYCEMWRASCIGELRSCTTTARSHHTSAATPARDRTAPAAAVVDEHTEPSPASFFVQVGDARVPNPAVAASPPVYGAAGISRPAFASAAAVWADSPFSPAAPHSSARSVVAPLTSVQASGYPASPAERCHVLRRGVSSTPVVDPSNPLYALETYSSRVFALPVGMKIGHTRLLACVLPAAESAGGCGGWRGCGGEELVRGLFTHVPAAATLSAAQRAASAIRSAEALRATTTATTIDDDNDAAAAAVLTTPAALPATSPSTFSRDVVVESDRESTDSCSSAVAAKEEAEEEDACVGDKDEDDDWEAAALLAEAALQHTPPPISPPLPTTALPAASASLRAARRSTTAGAVPPSPLSPVLGAATAPARASLAPSSALTPTADGLADQLQHSLYTTKMADVCAVLDDVRAVLPPPSAWWLRRGLSSAGTAPNASSLRLPLYVHCVEASGQWVEWVNALQFPVCAPSAVELRGVSLSGWSATHVQTTLVPSAKLEQINRALPPLEQALPSSLPLRGLHLETTAAAVHALLRRAVREDAAWRRSLVALDLPFLRPAERKADTLPLASSAEAVDEAALFTAVLGALPRLRFLSLSRCTAALGGPQSVENVFSADGGPPVLLEELWLHGVTDLPSSVLSVVGRRGGFLTLLDLSSTAITDSDLLLLFVCSTSVTAAAAAAADDDDADGASARPAAPPATALVWLEELRLAGCHHFTQLRHLAALPRLRRLNLQSSSVRSLAEVALCRTLEDVNVTRCTFVTHLSPLWRLPHLRSVEAAGVRQLRHDGGVLPLRPNTPFADASLDVRETPQELLAAPLVRLDLSQAADLSGPAVGLLVAALHDAGGRLHSVTTLVLDNTDTTDELIDALAGVWRPSSWASAAARSGDETPAVVAAALEELSIAGCRGVRRAGPLGLLPRLRSLVADNSGLEHLDGLQRSGSLQFVSVAHCGRLWSVAALAGVAPLRVLDLSRTPLNDAGLLRFVFPQAVEDVIAQQLHPGRETSGLSQRTAAVSGGGALREACLVPSQVEELRLYQCAELRYIGCLAHLPRLHRLDVSHAAVFDRGFVGFFTPVDALLRIQLQPSGRGGAVSWAEEEEGRGVRRPESERAAVPMPDEPALLRAWRVWRQREAEQQHQRHQQHAALSSSSSSLVAAPTTKISQVVSTASVAAGPEDDEFVFGSGAAATLAHLSFAYSAEVRNIVPCALFTRLSSLDLTGTAVDSPALLAFVNLLHECCGTEAERQRDGGVAAAAMRLEMTASGLRARPCGTTRASAAPRCPPRRPYTLTSLTLSFCPYITDVRCCATVPSLRHLALCGSPVTNASIEGLAAPPSSASLSSDSAAATRAEERWWLEHQCALRSLDVRYCRHITDVSALLGAREESCLQPHSTGAGGGRGHSGDAAPLRVSALRVLLLDHSGVTLSRRELRERYPFSHCAFEL